MRLHMRVPENGHDSSALVGFLSQICRWLLIYVDHNSEHLSDFTLQIGQESTRYRRETEAAPGVAILGEIPSEMSGLIMINVPVDWTERQYTQARTVLEEWLPALKLYSGLTEFEIKITGREYGFKHSVSQMLMLPTGAFDSKPLNKNTVASCLVSFGKEFNRIAELPYASRGGIENFQIMLGDQPLVEYGNIPEKLAPDRLIITFPHQATDAQILEADDKMQLWLPDLQDHCGRPIVHEITRGPNPQGMRPLY